tara:strand:+ start:223 stop:1131 length:909 start_codon:yes stop_codon:yes gene_type:complete
MLKYFFLIIIFLFPINGNSNENLLTIQQQLERLQREVSDLSQTVFSSNNEIKSNNSNDMVKNLSAIDMRIYDLETDVKTLTSNLEEIYFQLEDISQAIISFEDTIVLLENKLLDFSKTYQSLDIENLENRDQNQNENSLGSLKITTENNTNDNNTEENTNSKSITDTQEEPKLSPEDEFQLAFDNIRNKNWDEAKNSFIKFIENNPQNQLSGSAHYWLGELYILEKEYRDAALIFAEGYQSFPESIKAPDMLFKLSQSLYEVEKINESCQTLEKLILDFPKNKLIKNANKQLQNYGCLQANE